MIKELISTINIPFDDWTKYNLAYLGYIISGIENKDYDNLVAARLKYRSDKQKSLEEKRIAAGQSVKPDPLGMSISFNMINEKLLRAELFHIDTTRPEILAHIPETEYQILRSLSSLKELTEGTDIKINPRVVKLTSHFDIKWATNMVLSHSLFLYNLETFSTPFVRVLTANDYHVCSSCKPYHNKVLPKAQVPQLPHSGCTCKYGCRCYIQPASRME